MNVCHLLYKPTKSCACGKRTMVVSRKNARDFRGVVISPHGHLVLPDKRRLSRDDARCESVVVESTILG